MAGNTKLFAGLEQTALDAGAYRASVIDARKVVLDASFRTICESNACGAYGRCWACPPDVGDIDVLMRELSAYSWALVFQSVGMLEDSFDIEGMGRSADDHARLTLQVRDACKAAPFSKQLCLAAGGCHVCASCAKTEGKPCRFPDRMLVSLEAYGVNVSALADAAGMKYINGQNTVTFFSAIFFNL